ncbi:uncharacterized protein LOC105183422 [Harpegnathos saltator]|uniref:Uncharacterized protein n=1 Tax=Harpegnathos saltator TaxID=610380 RepID=E2BJ58_HARSA|nr:uncharacterized protein LOC105183422 [Harpegnathos saltator]EFN84208.1 hypothetical protein EAI_09996 [Harpegnathos saltator]
MKITNSDEPVEGSQTYTEKMVKWIGKVNYKKLTCSTSPKRNLRVETLLSCTLDKARYNLRCKQVARLNRWRQVRSELLKDVYYGSCAVYHEIEAQKEKDQIIRGENELQINWFEELGLEDLDEFLHQISGIKTSVER